MKGSLNTFVLVEEKKHMEMLLFNDCLLYAKCFLYFVYYKIGFISLLQISRLRLQK